jgi:hypothetical protein
MDLASAQLIISLLQEDVRRLQSGSRDGKVQPDAAFADAALESELHGHKALLTDRSMAQSLCLATLRDGKAIASAIARENQELQDRDGAAYLAMREGADPVHVMPVGQREYLQRIKESIHLLPKPNQEPEVQTKMLASVAEGCRLYIGNLAYATTEEQLKDFFSAYKV